jgi:hypothetical protein
MKKQPEDSGPDEATAFYNDNTVEREREFEMAFENPVFDDKVQDIDSDAFNNESVEALEL